MPTTKGATIFIFVNLENSRVSLALKQFKVYKNKYCCPFLGLGGSSRFLGSYYRIIFKNAKLGKMLLQRVAK
jgi:hypothetical protein